jgi:hypothetical protein
MVDVLKNQECDYRESMAALPPLGPPLRRAGPGGKGGETQVNQSRILDNIRTKSPD